MEQLPVRLYSQSGCGPCAHAKALLIRRGIFRQRLFAETGRATVPQVVVGGRPLGGAAELARLDRRAERPRVPAIAGLEGRSPKVWDAVSGLSEEDARRLSKELDPAELGS
jgi:glutaredoxin